MKKSFGRIFKLGLLFLFAGCLLVGLGVTSTFAQNYGVIDITKAASTKVPLAVPEFNVQGQSANAQSVAQEFHEFLVACLNFPGYFNILDKAGYLYNPQTDDAAQVNYQNWRAIGAELLVTGVITVNGDNVQLDMRLFDTFRNERVLGKRYTGYVRDKRVLIQKFCSEIMLALVGNKGVYNTQIAFVSTGGNVKEIYTCEFDGHNPQRLTYDNSISIFPAWSADGKWISYTTYKNKKTDMVIRNMQSGSQTIIDRQGTTIKGDWLPTQDMVAASFSFTGNQCIYLLDTKGNFVETLVQGGGSNLSPTFSPDGTKMAFVSSRSGGPQVYVLDRTTGQVKRISFEGKYNTQPSWSPKGDRIAYSSQIAGYHQICVTDPDGSFVMQLTNSNGDNSDASWSPDGSMIVFTSSREGSSRLYVMTAFGADQRRLMRLSGDQTSPAWSMHHLE